MKYSLDKLIDYGDARILGPKEFEITSKHLTIVAGHSSDVNQCLELFANDIWKNNESRFVVFSEDSALFTKQMFLNLADLMIVPITSCFLEENSTCLNEDILLAMQSNLPILPIGMEVGIEKRFEETMKRLDTDFRFYQILPRYTFDEVASSDYYSKLEKRLADYYLKLADIEKIKNAFYDNVFISYRKKDREHVLHLEHNIHCDKELLDVGIWYDGYLTPGENYSAEIEESIKRSDCVVFLITPRMFELPNYVVDYELPLAINEGKKLIAIELEKCDKKDKYNEIFKDIPLVNSIDELIYFLKKNRLINQHKKNFETADYFYYIGMAYRKGIGVEKNRSVGFDFIKKAAEEGSARAMKQLGMCYCNGDGVGFDLKEGCNYLMESFRLMKQLYDSTQDNSLLMEMYVTLSSCWSIMHFFTISESDSPIIKRIELERGKIAGLILVNTDNPLPLIVEMQVRAIIHGGNEGLQYVEKARKLLKDYRNKLTNTYHDSMIRAFEAIESRCNEQSFIIDIELKPGKTEKQVYDGINLINNFDFSNYDLGNAGPSETDINYGDYIDYKHILGDFSEPFNILNTLDLAILNNDTSTLIDSYERMKKQFESQFRGNVIDSIMECLCITICNYYLNNRDVFIGKDEKLIEIFSMGVSLAESNTMNNSMLTDEDCLSDIIVLYDALSELYEKNEKHYETRCAADACISYLEKEPVDQENTVALFVMYSRIAYSYLQEGKEDKFIDSLQKNISVWKRIDNPDCVTLNNIGISYLNLCKYYSSREKTEKSLALSKEAISFIIEHYSKVTPNDERSTYVEIENNLISIFENGLALVKRASISMQGSDLWFRDLAFRLVQDNIMLGYSFMSIWFSYRSDIHKRIISLIKAAEGGVPSANDLIQKLEKTAINDEISIILAECYFLIGDDEKGISWMKKARELGVTGADIGLDIKRKEITNTVVVNNISDAHIVFPFFNGYIFSTKTFDLSKLELTVKNKATLFLKGAVDSRGGEIVMNDSNSTIEVRRTIFERDLVDKDVDDRVTEKTYVKEDRDLEDIKKQLLMGKAVVVDFSKCPTETARRIFDYLAGFVYGLAGTLDSMDKDAFKYIPAQMEYQGNR